MQHPLQAPEVPTLLYTLLPRPSPSSANTKRRGDWVSSTSARVAAPARSTRRCGSAVSASRRGEWPSAPQGLEPHGGTVFLQLLPPVAEWSAFFFLRKGRVTEEFSTFGVSDADRTHPNFFNQSMKEDDVREKLGTVLG